MIQPLLWCSWVCVCVCNAHYMPTILIIIRDTWPDVYLNKTPTKTVMNSLLCCIFFYSTKLLDYLCLYGRKKWLLDNVQKGIDWMPKHFFLTGQLAWYFYLLKYFICLNFFKTKPAENALAECYFVLIGWQEFSMAKYLNNQVLI